MPRDVPRRERLLVLGAMAAGVAAVLLYVLTTRSHALNGDELFYDETARYWADGKLWWASVPFGEAHPTAWKPPLYPALVGTLYSILGESPLRVEYVQALLAAVTVGLTWAFARRLFGPTPAIVAAWVVALFPLAFEYYGLLFPEALAIPLTLLALSLFVEREPTVARALLVGAVIGVGLLVRPTSAFLFVGVLAAFVVTAGWRRGPGLTALAVVAAALVVAPWTIRNYAEHDGFIPISVQDGAVYGTFNEEAARDDFAWRAFLEEPAGRAGGPRPGYDGGGAALRAAVVRLRLHRGQPGVGAEGVLLERHRPLLGPAVAGGRGRRGRVPGPLALRALDRARDVLPAAAARALRPVAAARPAQPSSCRWSPRWSPPRSRSR